MTQVALPWEPGAEAAAGDEARESIWGSIVGRPVPCPSERHMEVLLVSPALPGRRYRLRGRGLSATTSPLFPRIPSALSTGISISWASS